MLLSFYNKLRRRQFVVVLAALAILFAHAAFADDAVDKSNYTLFNPTPADQMRDFSTDRPAKANSPTTVDAGHFQYESDILSWSYDRYSTTRQTTSNLIVFDPVLKAGLTDRTDLEIAVAPINSNHMTDRSDNTHGSSFGFGDVTTRLKVNLFGNDGGRYALALVPFVKIPTASVPVGNGHFEGGAYAPFTISLPDNWSVTLETELDMLENSSGSGVHPNYQNLVNVDVPIADKLTGQVELWSDVDKDSGAATQYTFDLAAIWAFTKTLQFDVGSNIGLNKAAPDLQIYTGISQRF